MKKWLCVLLCACCMFAVPRQALAMDFDIRFGKEEDRWIGEVWYERALLWQLAFSPSGAIPVSTGQAKYQTVVTPDFQNGFFLFRVK